MEQAQGRKGWHLPAHSLRTLEWPSPFASRQRPNGTFYFGPPQGGRKGDREQDVPAQPRHSLRPHTAPALREGEQAPCQPQPTHLHDRQLVPGGHVTGMRRQAPAHVVQPHRGGLCLPDPESCPLFPLKCHRGSGRGSERGTYPWRPLPLHLTRLLRAHLTWWSFRGTRVSCHEGLRSPAGACSTLSCTVALVIRHWALARKTSHLHL